MLYVRVVSFGMFVGLQARTVSLILAKPKAT